MQGNSAALAKQAVEAALKGSWDQAVELNTQILEIHPNDIDAKARLGKAYLQTGLFSKAKKIYKEILKRDPINTIALKNYKLAKEKIEPKTPPGLNAKASIKEPGTSIEVSATMTATRTTAADFAPSEELKLKINKKSVQLLKDGKKIGEITQPPIINSLKRARAQKAAATANYIGSKDKSIKVVLRSTEPVFKSAKQTVKPYLKKGTIDEPEIEMIEVEE